MRIKLEPCKMQCVYSISLMVASDIGYVLEFKRAMTEYRAIFCDVKRKVGFARKWQGLCRLKW